MYPPPHMAHMHPPPHVTHMYSPPHMTHTVSKLQRCSFFRAKEIKEKQQGKRKLKQQGKKKLKYQDTLVLEFVQRLPRQNLSTHRST